MKAFFPILIIFLLGCEVIVDIKIPEEKPKLTLNSFFNPDSIWRAELTLNRHILNNKNFQRIDDALLVVYEGENPVDTLISKGDGIYQSDSGKPVAGKSYQIKAITESYGTVMSRSIIPHAAEVTSYKINGGAGHPGKTLTITFKDDPLEKNYYQILLYVEGDHTDPDTLKTIQQVQIESTESSVQADNLNLNDGILLSDILFNGKEFEHSFKDLNGYVGKETSSTVILRTISEDYYKYKTTLQQQNHLSGDPFAQPLNIYNNIENGFGVFAGYNESIYKYSPPVPVITGFSPLKGKSGDHIIISGENFLTGILLYFNAEPYPVNALVENRTNTQLEVIIPEHAISGKIIISLYGRLITSDRYFEITD